MIHTINSIKAESLPGSADNNQKGVEKHKKAATHFESAAKKHGKALKRAIIAQRNKWLYTEYQLELVNPFCD